MNELFGAIMATAAAFALISLFMLSGWVRGAEAATADIKSDCERFGAFYVEATRYTCAATAIPLSTDPD
jgi:hypothetical protein